MVNAPFFLTFTQLDLPLIGAPEAADFSTQCAVNTKFMNPLWLEGESAQKKYLFAPLIKQLARLELLKETTAGRVVWSHCLVMVGEIRWSRSGQKEGAEE